MQKRFIILFVLVAAFVVPQMSFAQRNLEKGNRLFDMNQYKKAIPFFEKDANSDDKAVKLEATFRLADCYRLLGDFENAEKIYKKLINKGGGKEAIYQYALALKAAAKYYEAKKEFLNYIKLAPNDPRGYMNAKSCDFAQQMLDAEPLYDVRELKTINTENVDIAPVYYKGGIVFSSQRKGGKKPFVSFEGASSEVLLDLYYMDFDGTEASLSNKIYFLPGINSNLHEGPATFSADGREIYFTRTVEGERLNKTDKVVQNTLQIFYSQIQGDTAWSTPVSAFSFNSIEYSVLHPCITKDGKRIFFASNMPNGFGGTDIYVVYKQKDGTWSEPFNLGPDVNTTENELYPFYDNKGHLYFSSNGHPGMGKLDIFKSTYDSLYGWTFIENMKVPINSIGDDICYVESDNSGRGFLVSNRINGTGGDDIYTFTKKQPFEIEIDQKYLRVKNNTAYDGLTYSIKLDGEKSSTDLMEEQGYFIYEPASEVKYVLTARKDGFLNNQVTFSIKNNEDGSRELVITPKLEDVYVKAFIGHEKVLDNAVDSVLSDSAAKEDKMSFFAKLISMISASKSGAEYSFKDLLAYKKFDSRENMEAYEGIKAQHFIEEEFVGEIYSDAAGEVMFQTAASQSNKITIAAIPQDAKPAEKAVEEVVQQPIEVKDDLNWYKQGSKVFGHVVAKNNGDVKRNVTFVLKKNGEEIGNIQSDENGNLKFNDLEFDSFYSLSSTDDQGLVFAFLPIAEHNKNTKEFTFSAKPMPIAKVLVDNQIEYDEIIVEELFLTIPAGDEGEEKVLGQVIFNGKKMQDLEVEIIIDGKVKTLAKTGRNKFFVAYMNPKNKNAFHFVIDQQQYKIPLSAKDFKKRRKYLEVVVSVDAASGEPLVQAFQENTVDSVPQGKMVQTVEPIKEIVAEVKAEVKEEIKTEVKTEIKSEVKNPLVINTVSPAVTPAAATTEVVSGVVDNGKALLFDAELRIFEEGEFVAKTKTDQNGHYTFNIKPNAFYTITAAKEGFKFEQKTFIGKQLKQSTGKIEVNFTLTYKKPVTLTGQVLSNNAPVADATVDVYKDDAVVKKTKTDTLGNYKVELREKEKYTLSITKSGYFQTNTEITTGAASDTASKVDVKVKLSPIVENKSVSIPNIYFEYKLWKLTEASMVELDRLVVFMNQNPQIATLQIFAYTDNIGSDEYNLVLSQKRASSVLEYLIKKGVPRQKLIATGMGEKDLVIKNASTESEHAKNRRTEFKVILQK